MNQLAQGKGQSRPALHCGPTLVFASILLLGACSREPDSTVRLPENASARKGDDPPVMVNSQTPVEYPAALFARGIEGKVVLRLFADTAGALVGDSTRVAESSGYPALDSAALAAVPQFKFAPALKDGEPIAGAFLQPVHFRHPQAGGTTP
jgi:TonB family protein